MPSPTQEERHEERRGDAEVRGWRFRRFRSIGFDEAVATLLADGEVDWHDAERLVLEQGCSLELAARILA